MADNPLIKRYLDAGMAFTQMTQARAEAIVADLVKTGEVQAQKAEKLVGQLLERSRANTERLLDQVRAEVQAQIAALGLATQDDIARLETRIDAAAGATPAKKSAKKRAKKAATSTKKTAKKPGKKSTAKKSAATKSAATKSGATKRPAKKSAASRRS